MLQWIRFLSLRSKLIILIFALLTIPWMGNRYIQEIKEFLVLGQKEALLLTSNGIASILNERTELFQPDTGVPELIGEETDLFIHQLDRALSLDGATTDWSMQVLKKRSAYTPGDQVYCAADYQADDFSFTHVLGYRGSWLYALFEVTDDQLIYRDRKSNITGLSDQLRLTIQHPYSPLARYVLIPDAVGRLNTYLVQDDWTNPVLGQPISDIVGVLKETDYGYNIELRIPRYRVNTRSRIGFSLVDVDDVITRAIKSTANTFPQAENNLPGRVLMTTPELSQIISRLDQPNSRIWVLDTEQQVRAVIGDISPGKIIPEQRIQNDSWYESLFSPFLDRLNRWFKLPEIDFEDLPSTLTHRRGDVILEVLSGQSMTATRRSVDDKVKIVMAGSPIRNGNDIIGAVVIEQSSHHILTGQYNLLKSLAAASLTVFAFIALMLVIFSWRLTVRIGRLRDTTEQAISPEGRLREEKIPDRLFPKDEIGDLARSITSMLRRLSGYTRYLEGLPDTLAHELNNPLNVVSSSLQNLESSQPDLLNNKYVIRAQGGVHRLRNILTNLTEAANLEEAMQSEHRERININQLLSYYIEGANTLYPYHTLKLLQLANPLFINGSPDHFAELLDKLVDNAVQFGIPNTEIVVTITEHDERIELSVTNEGPMVSKDMLQRIFDPMVSVGRKDAKQSHLGLGLYVVRLICDFHGGRVWAENRADKLGVVIKLNLPSTK